MKCFNVVVVVEGYDSMLDVESSTRTPLSVLDRRCTKWECKNIPTINTTVGPEKRDIKRRKMMKQIQQSSRE